MLRLSCLFCVCASSVLIWSCGKETSTAKSQNNSAQTQQVDPMFEDVPASESGIDFKNVLVENDTLNYHNYGYLYNGGGVAILDYDNDGFWDLYFSSTQGSNTLYHNLGEGKFENVTQQAGVGGKNALATGVVVTDVNHDGLADLYVCYSGPWEGSRISNELFVNQGDGTFVEESVARGLDDASHTSHALWVDIDNDNDLDLYLINHRVSFDKSQQIRIQQTEDGDVKRILDPEQESVSDRLFLNTGNGNFRDISKSAGIVNNAFGLSALAIDINDDGWQDIFVCNDFIEPDYMYVNQGDGTFVDRISDYFQHLSQNSMGSDAADINNDGLDDIVVLDMLAEPRPRRYTQETNMMVDRSEVLNLYGYKFQVMKNVLHLNLGDGNFSEIGEYAGIEATDWSWAPLINDFDNDGLRDIFISNGYRRDFTNSDYLRYVDEHFEDGISENLSLRELFDLVPYNPVSNYLYINQGDFKFENMAGAWGVDQKSFTNGAVIVDIDNDGDVDIFTNNVEKPAGFFRNLTSDKTDNHFLRVGLEGPAGNNMGLGSRVIILTPSGRKEATLRNTRGFFSSTEPVVHFGLGKETRVDSLYVSWPDGKVSMLTDVETDKLIKINYRNARSGKVPVIKSQYKLFSELSSSTLSFAHRENAFVDVKREPLIPRPFSRMGPCIIKGDVNNDGMVDVFIGGARGQASAMFIQHASGSFTRIDNPIFEEDRDYEDVDAVLEDFNGDRQIDLYVGSGGSSENQGSFLYHDRLYFGNGDGTFRRAQLPKYIESTGAVAASDIDNDGDMDIFVGGYLVPNRYPQSPESILLINSGNGSFGESKVFDFDDQMISDAAFADIDGNGTPDLVVVGEWMAPTVYLNNNGKFQVDDNNGLEAYTGWWNALLATDIDGDGDIDLVCGNYGENSRFEANKEEPLSVVANDFDRNGKYDAIISMYFLGEEFPVPRRDDLLGQIPSLKKKYTDFKSYSTAKVEDIFDAESMSNAYRKSANTLTSMLFVNDGKGKFSASALPAEAQFFPIFAIEEMDCNGDGKKDLLIGGNDLHAQVETYRIDAGRGWVLIQNPDGSFSAPGPVETGFNIQGEIRSIKKITTPDAEIVLVGRSNDAVVALKKVQVIPSM